jgi:hypothetical protein
MPRIACIFILLCLLPGGPVYAGSFQSPDSFNVARIAANPLAYSDYLRTHAKALMHTGKDSCIEKIINAFCGDVTRKKNLNSLITLDSLCSKSDGGIAEEMDGIGSKLFYSAFPLTVNYLSSHKGSCMEDRIVYGISGDIAIRAKSKTEIKSFILKQIKSGHFNKAQQAYIWKLYDRFDPHIWD